MSVIKARVRTCNCYEVGIKTDTLLFSLIKMQDKRWENIHAVEKCEHWEEVVITAPKELGDGNE